MNYPKSLTYKIIKNFIPNNFIQNTLMNRRKKQLVAYTGNETLLENEIPIDVNYISYSTTPTVHKSVPRSLKTPSYSSRTAIRFKHHPSFSKNLPSGYDKEKLMQDHLAHKNKSFECAQENLKLKLKLNSLSNLIGEPSDEILRLKAKVKRLQTELEAKSDQALDLKNGIKSCKIPKRENEIESYINEACRLCYLLERVLCYDNSNNSRSLEAPSLVGVEIQSLLNENVQLSQATSQAMHELSSLKSKLSSLENKKKQEKLKKKIAGLKKQSEALKKTIIDEQNTFDVAEKELNDRVTNQKNIETHSLLKLEKLEIRFNQQEMIIKEMKRSLNLKANAFTGKKRALTVINNENSDKSPIKLGNPPKLLMKIHQILKKKRMIVSVFLSLIDKYNNGVMTTEHFIQSLKENGKNVKMKYVEEVLGLMGMPGTNIYLYELDDFYEKYRYDINYYSSSSDNEDLPKNSKSPKTPKSPQSPKSPKRPDAESIVPSTGLINLIKTENNDKKLIPLPSSSEIFPALQEIKNKMVLLNNPKATLIYLLFGNDFDPNLLLNSNELYNILNAFGLSLSKETDLKLLGRYLVEPEGTDGILESEINNIKESIKNISKKLQKILPDWEVYSEDQEKDFEKILNDFILSNKEKIKKNCIENDKTQEGSIKISDFILILKTLGMDFNDKINTWLVSKAYKLGYMHKIPYFKLLDTYKAVEPLIISDKQPLLVNDDDKQNLYREIADNINAYGDINIFFNTDMIPIRDFRNILDKIKPGIPDTEFSSMITGISDENSVILSNFVDLLKDYGLYVKENSYYNEEFEDSKSIENDEKYSEGFENDRSMEEGIQEEINHETELDFVQYNISFKVSGE